MSLRDDGCRVWQGATARGYGKRWVDGRLVLLHRWVWEKVNGPIPPSAVVMHTCDNPPCYRYSHLRVGTQAENLADMRAKGRARHSTQGAPRGAGNGMSTLTDEQVVEIRAACARGETQRRLAERYGVAPSTITRIKKGQVW